MMMEEAAAHSTAAAQAETTQWAELTSVLEEMEVRQQRGNDAEKAESQADGEESGGSMVGPHQLSSWRRYRTTSSPVGTPFLLVAVPGASSQAHQPAAFLCGTRQCRLHFISK